MNELLNVDCMEYMKTVGGGDNRPYLDRYSIRNE